MSNDLIVFASEDENHLAPLPPWKILVVDDDHDIHLSTSLVLKNTQLLGRTSWKATLPGLIWSPKFGGF